MLRKFTNETEISICSMYLSGATIWQIANIFSAGYTTIRNVLKRNNVKRRNTGCLTKFIGEIEIIIISMYKSGGTLRQIADIFSCNNSTIHNVLKRNNIKRRNPSPVPNVPIELEGKLLEMMEGHLLGDGFVSRPETVNCYFSIASKYEKYAKFVAETLEMLEPSEVKKMKPYQWGKLFLDYYFDTKHLISPEYRKRWYPNGIKIIPNDLKLTPTICLYWYLDDGGFHSYTKIAFNTQSFTRENIEETILPQLQQILGDKNNDIKIYMLKYESGLKPIILIPRRYTKRFLEYIGDCPINCFKYKWDIKPYKRKGYKYL